MTTSKPPRSPGRPKGSKNKMSSAVVQRILGTLDELDALTGEDGKPKYPGGSLLCLAQSDPRAFASLLGRCLPKDVNLSGEVAVTFEKMLSDLEATAKLVA